MDAEDELLDIVDRDDNVMGRERRSIVYNKGLSNFRVINVFIRNDKGEIWIPRRAAGKKLFPLHLDVSAGGHVASGESYEDAFRREVMEELNIDTGAVCWRVLGCLTPHNDDVSAFQKVYEIDSNQTPDFNRRDFVEHFWLMPKDAGEIIRAGEPAKGDLLKLLRILYRV